MAMGASHSILLYKHVQTHHQVRERCTNTSALLGVSDILPGIYLWCKKTPICSHQWASVVSECWAHLSAHLRISSEIIQLLCKLSGQLHFFKLPYDLLTWLWYTASWWYYDLNKATLIMMEMQSPSLNSTPSFTGCVPTAAMFATIV